MLQLGINDMYLTHDAFHLKCFMTTMCLILCGVVGFLVVVLARGGEFFTNKTL